MAQRRRAYAVTGATGNIGRPVAEALLRKGHWVNAISRSISRLEPLVNAGAEPFVGDLCDPVFLEMAFAGVDAVFTMIPPNGTAQHYRDYQNRISESIVEALGSVGIRYVVNLSSVGAHRGDRVGPIKGLFDHEQRLNALRNANVIHVRPPFFFENLYSTIDMIRQLGGCGTPLRGDLLMPMMATRDIAGKVAELLLALDFEGKSFIEILGEGDLLISRTSKNTMKSSIETFAEEFDKELRHGK